MGESCALEAEGSGASGMKGEIGRVRNGNLVG
jgi:hypothetical protein